MPFYRKKPVVIEAVKWTGFNTQQCLAFLKANGYYEVDGETQHLVIKTLEDGKGEVTAKHVATVGDYIIKGISGEFYFCKPDIFAATYDDLLGGPI